MSNPTKIPDPIPLWTAVIRYVRNNEIRSKRVVIQAATLNEARKKIEEMIGEKGLEFAITKHITKYGNE